MIFALLIGLKSISSAAPIDDVTLGSAGSYGLLTGSALTMDATATIVGDPSSAGIFPGTVGPTMSALVVADGATRFDDGIAPADQAQTDLGTAISAIAALTPTQVAPLFSNQTLTPGVYAAPTGTALAITVGLTLDGGGDSNSRFVFRTDSALNIDASVHITLTNGAQERNVFWMVGSAVTIGATSDVPGNFLVVSAATIGANDIIRGSILCEGAVTIGGSSSIIYHHVNVTQAISFTSTPTTPTYGGTYNIVATGGGSGNPVTFTSATTSVCTISGSIATFVGSGTCTIDANQVAGGNYLVAPQVAQTFVISIATQVISYTSTPTTPTYGGTYNLTSTSGASGNPVVYTSATLGVCTISGSTVTFVGNGTCTVNANQVGTSNYSAATQVQQTFTVVKVTITITSSNASKVNGASDPAISGYSITSGTLVNGDVISGISASRAIGESVASYAITPSAAVFSTGSISNYTIISVSYTHLTLPTNREV